MLTSHVDFLVNNSYNSYSYVAYTYCGPRQPCHDLHCQIEGSTAYDVLKNFDLVDVEHIPEIASPSGTTSNDHQLLWISKEDDPKNWHIQIFRSVDSKSVEAFLKHILTAKEQVNTNRSIQIAYIQAIRSNQRFIFIENQYFIRSSFVPANNLIPIELALKIVSKIRANERSVVYIIIYMWPEGKPYYPHTKKYIKCVIINLLNIKHVWRTNLCQTMQMMYNIIAHQLKSVNLKNAHPTDYLNFYCLDNREESHKEESSSTILLYMHSKGMKVDDEYVIMGSANINKQSMASYRDTKIVMGACLPHYTWTKTKKTPI
ncbi:hypothetical protein MIMGU_mgv1a026012mg, partial [Erythranthe guttata]